MFKTLLCGMAAAGGIMLTSPSSAQASNVQTTMAVTTTNVNACVVAALPLAFGSLNQVNGNANDSQTTITVTCTLGVAFNVGLDAGAHASGGTRQMQAIAGTATIPYNVYSDAQRTTAWGNTLGTDTVARTAGAVPSLLTVYGRIPASGATAPGGAYADLVTVTVTF